MLPRIPIDQIEKIIYFYVRVREIRRKTGNVKIKHSLMIKARELGFSARAAEYFVEFAKQIGMIEKSV